jgi:hypothetical protein
MRCPRASRRAAHALEFVFATRAAVSVGTVDVSTSSRSVPDAPEVQASRLRAIAPVNAPRSWNNSLSTIPSIAAVHLHQRLFRRELCRESHRRSIPARAGFAEDEHGKIHRRDGVTCRRYSCSAGLSPTMHRSTAADEAGWTSLSLSCSRAAGSEWHRFRK